MTKAAPKAKLIDEVSVRVLHPDRLRALLETYLKSAQSRASEGRERVARLRQAHKEAEAGIARLLTLVEEA